MAKMIKVTGNQGKSIFSFYLAKELSSKSKVIVLSADESAAPCSALFFDNESKKSLGRLLAKPVITKQDIFSQMNFYSDDLGYLGYASGENIASYPKVLPENIKRLLDQLLELTDYCIIDGKHFGSKIETVAETYRPLSIFIASADRKGVAYRNAFDQQPKGQIDVVLNNSRFNYLPEIMATYRHSPKYILPYAKELNSIYNTTGIANVPVPKGYGKVIKAVREKIC